jgi:hypothetical protein
MFRVRWFAGVVVALLIALPLLADQPRPRGIHDPYAQVDWTTYQRHHGNFHTHTTQSDGKQSPASVIDHYHAIGHDVLALTDHNKNTWPWVAFGRDPHELGMVAVPGNELSRHHHTLSLFCELETPTTDHETGIQQIAQNDGISVLAHPGRYWQPNEGQVPDDVRMGYVRLYKRYPSLIGMEVINQADRYPQDRALWDAVLTDLMPDRPVWGMANDDSHQVHHIGLNTTVLLLAEHNLPEVRKALENGRFYFTTVTSHPPDQRDRRQIPVIEKIETDQQAGLIRIRATVEGRALPDDAFRWITAGGQVVHVGPVVRLGETAIDKYVRAELRGPGGTAYTQPFGITDAPTNQP